MHPNQESRHETESPRWERIFLRIVVIVVTVVLIHLLLTSKNEFTPSRDREAQDRQYQKVLAEESTLGGQKNTQ